MLSRIVPVLAAAALCAPGTAASASAAADPVPPVMAALGDSISAGFNACGWYVVCPSRSWSAGDSSDVESHYLRLLAIGKGVRGHNLNFAVPGSTSAGLAAQAARAVTAGATYVTVLIGAQDACAAKEARMTPVPVYRANVDRAFATLATAGVKVFAASIPDVRRLWRLGKDSVVARSFWALGHICPAMLANSGSAARKDQARRDRVRERVEDYNAQMAAACAAYGPGCRSDGGAVFAYPFTLDHISRWDFFHPNADGQRALARATFGLGFRWESGTLTREAPAVAARP